MGFWDNLINYIVPPSTQPPTTTSPPPSTSTNQGLVQQWYAAHEEAKVAPAQQTSQQGTQPSSTIALPHLTANEALPTTLPTRPPTLAEKAASDITSFLSGGIKTVSSDISAIFSPITASPQVQSVVRTLFPTQAQPTQLSSFSTDVYNGASRVANVIDTGMGIADIGARRIQRNLPTPLADIYGGIYSIGRGIVFTGESGLVRTAGMIPGGIEAISKQPEMIPAFIATGVVTQVSGLQKGITENPLQTIGEFAVMSAVAEGITAAPRTIREAIPYDISIGAPKGVLVDVGKIYSVKSEVTPDIPGLVTRTTEIAPERIQPFATHPVEGISNVYMRLPQSAVSRLQAEAIVSAPEFVSTPYGSYMKVSIEGIKEATNTRMIEGTAKPASIIDNFPIRIEKKLDIHPIEFKLSESYEKAQIPEYTNVYDVHPEGIKVAKPGMNYDVWGGNLEGAASKPEISGTIGFKQLSRPKLQTLEELFSAEAPSPKVTETRSGISFTQPDVPYEMPASTEGLGGFGGFGKRTITAVKEPLKPIIEQRFVDDPFEMVPQLQPEQKTSTRRKVMVAEREPIIESLRGLEFPKKDFKKTPSDINTIPDTSTSEKRFRSPTTEELWADRTLTDESMIEATNFWSGDTKTTLGKTSKGIPFYLNKDNFIDTNIPPEPFRDTYTPPDKIPEYTTDIFTPTPTTKPDTSKKQFPIYAPDPAPDPFPFPSVFPDINPQPKLQPKGKANPEPDTSFDTFSDFRIPNIPPKIFPTTGFEEVNLRKKKRKTKRKITSYIVKNQLADLEDVLGSVIQSTKRNSSKKGKEKPNDFSMPTFELPIMNFTLKQKKQTNKRR